jgi:uncharacterized protein YukE
MEENENENQKDFSRNKKETSELLNALISLGKEIKESAENSNNTRSEIFWVSLK